jgi:hypothetical protein
MELFGFEIKKKNKKEEEQKKSFVPPMEDDGAVVVESSVTGTAFGSFIDLEGAVKNEIDLITRYRQMACQPEMERAIDHIVNESVITEDNGLSVSINCDDLKQPEKIKKKITEEFKEVLKMMNFGQLGHDLFKRWYVDGRFNYHIILDEANPKNGIVELRYIDPRRIRKVREIQKEKDPATGIDIIKTVKEYYLYNEKGIIGIQSNLGAKIAVDAIVTTTSGMVEPKNGMVISYLHKAIKALNNLRKMEDSVVIYRLTRAPERRVFYVDVSGLPTPKAEQYLKDQMVKHRNKVVYNASTGEIKDDRQYNAMIEDYWVPRRDGKNAEIDTLPGGQNLGDIEDVKYFQKKLYEALNVPIGRLEPEQGFSLGRATEITRDELHFHKFVQRLRNKFSTMFDDLMRIQCVTKGICTEEEWEEFKEYIWYDWIKDNNFEELKDAELFRDRLELLGQADPYIGRYFSKEYIMKNILKFNDDEIKEMQQQIDKEGTSGELPGFDEFGNAIVAGTGGGQPPPPDPMMGMEGEEGEAEGEQQAPETKPKEDKAKKQENPK